MQVCTLLQTANHASTPPTQFFTGRMRFVAPNQQSQSTEGTWWIFFGGANRNPQKILGCGILWI